MPADRIDFTGALGVKLAARFERPNGPTKAVALFAHCFACSKDALAASRIAAALADLGIAVLRFDFTGLGQSEGDFANTHFSSNVDDLVAAADWLRAERQAPSLIIGHSLGGAAAIVAAGRIPEVRAVATIGAPANAGHVAHHFADQVPAIERDGEATVQLGGRAFQVRRAFLDDIRESRVEAAAAVLKRALLVMHAPLDAVVGVENATALFLAAKHPKSFVSLDDADHLLTRKADAAYAASVIAAWASRYLDLDAAPAGIDFPAAPSEAHSASVRETGRGAYENAVAIGPHRLIADEPAEIGGGDRGPSPYEWLSAGLGACTSMTLRMYAARKGWPLERVGVEVSHHKDASGDASGKRDVFTRRISIEGQLDAEQRQRLLEIASKCPVHRTLEEGAMVRTELLGDGTSS